MEKISDFISERLKLTKEIKNELKNFCIIVPYDELYLKFKKEFKEYFISGLKSNIDNTNDIFVLPINVVKKYENHYALYAFEIPEEYTSFEEIKQDYIDDKLKLDDLKTFNFNKT